MFEKEREIEPSFLKVAMSALYRVSVAGLGHQTYFLCDELTQVPNYWLLVLGRTGGWKVSRRKVRLATWAYEEMWLVRS